MTKKINLNIKRVFDLALQNQNEKNFNEAKKLYKKLIGIEPRLIEAQYNLGVIYEETKNYNEAIKYYKKTINLNPSFIYSYNNLGLIYNKLGKYKDSIEYLTKLKKLNPQYINAYINLGITHISLGQYKEAIENFIFALNIDEKNSNSLYNLIQALRFCTPTIKNPIIEISKDLKKLYKNINFEELLVNNKDLSGFLNSAYFYKNKIKNLNFTNFFETQVYRQNTTDLNCTRHHDIFNKRKIIPKFCFGCFKVQIEPINVLNLIKLYIIFDNFKFPQNNIRKCLIELRPDVKGLYKGIIYCSSINEAEKVLKDLSPLLNKYLEYKSVIRRGCSEFYSVFPKFKTAKNEDNLMKYNDEWKKIELYEDEDKHYKKPVLLSSLQGVSVSDLMIIDKWLYYASIIGDKSFEDLKLEITKSKYIDYKMTNQKESRINQFQK